MNKEFTPYDLALELKELGFDEKCLFFYTEGTREVSENPQHSIEWVDFNKDFASYNTAPKISNNKNISFDLVLDKASAELIADNGLTVMTSIFFPRSAYTKFKVISNDKQLAKKINYSILF